MAGKSAWSSRRLFSYTLGIVLTLALVPFIVPLTMLTYLIVWVYTWTHDPRTRTHMLSVLPLHPRRVYHCARALWSGMLDGLGGPTVAIILSYVGGKLARSSGARDTRVRDIQYGPAASHRLDLFVPQGQAEGALPVVVVFPGYRWGKNRRARMYRPMAQTLCATGRFVVLPRVGAAGGTPGAAPPDDALADFHAAVQWVLGNAANFGGDPRRIHVLGYGAGAHLAMLYTLAVPLRTWYQQADRISPSARLLSTPQADQRLRTWLARIRGARPLAGLLLVSGVFDLAAQRKYEVSRSIQYVSATARTFGTPAPGNSDDAWSPAAIVRALRRRSAYIPAELFAQSVLLIHGQRDSTFVLAQSQRMFRELCDVDVPRVDMKIYANLRRVDPAIALLAPRSPLAVSLLADIGASLDGEPGRRDQQQPAAETGTGGEAVGDADTGYFGSRRRVAVHEAAN